MNNVYLIGFMGVGKSTIARSMEKRLQWKCVDLDRLIEEKAKMSICEIFRRKGEDFFRSLEKETLNEVSASSSQIISCGGGTVLDQENVKIMRKNGTVIWIDADISIILQRVKRRRDKRPLLRRKSDEDIKAMYEARKEIYSMASDHYVHSDDRTPYAVAAKIQKLLQIPFEVHDGRLKGGRLWQKG